MDASAIDIPKGYGYMHFDTFDRGAGPPFPFLKTELTRIWRPN